MLTFEFHAYNNPKCLTRWIIYAMPCQYVGKASMILNGISAAFEHKSQESLSSFIVVELTPDKCK